MTTLIVVCQDLDQETSLGYKTVKKKNIYIKFVLDMCVDWLSSFAHPTFRYLGDIVIIFITLEKG